MGKLVCAEVEEKHLDFISKSDNLNLQRLVDDLKKKYFYGFICKSEDNGDDFILGYILYYYSYSTWEARVAYISSIFLTDVDLDSKTHIFETMCLNLIEIARRMHCSRINYNLDIVKNPLYETLFVEKIRAFNLTKLESWTFFCMDYKELQPFSQIDREKFEIKLSSDKSITIRKMSVNSDCDGVRELIYELAVFEKLENQFRMKTEELVRDYKEYYDGFVACDSNTNEIIAFALYYFNYSPKNGRGCYLEDLYVKPEWRSFGIGTLLWRKVSDECLKSDASYLEWNCLEWNTSAIEFYLRNKAYNSSKINNTHYIRIRRERINED
jgi:diamine N-acetyltransferase